MKKNTASQKIGAQMVSATDGSAFTGSVTVYVTGDAGTQAVGSVGAGACTHEGNGYHTYAPAQAETNYNLVAFTFTGTGAVPATIQIETESIDRHDTVRMGLTAIPNAAADAAGGLPISDAGGLDLDNRMPAAAAVTNLNVVYNTDFATNYNTTLDCWSVDLNTIKTNAVVNGGTITFPTGATLASTTNITAGTITTVTNLTNAPTSGDLTATMKTSVTTACTASTPIAASVTGAVGSVTGAVGSVTGAVGSVTGNVGGNVTGSVGSIATGGITTASFFAGATIPRCTLTDTITTYTGNTLQTGDSYALIGATGSGLTSLATAANLATAITYIDTEVAAILADTNELQTDLVNGGRLDLLVDAIKAKTDLIPASPAAVGSAMTLDLTQAVATSNTAQTMGDCLNAARAQGFGKWAISGTTLSLYANDGTTVVKSFTLDSASTPTSRTPA